MDANTLCIKYFLYYIHLWFNHLLTMKFDFLFKISYPNIKVFITVGIKRFYIDKSYKNWYRFTDGQRYHSYRLSVFEWFLCMCMFLFNDMGSYHWCGTWSLLIIFCRTFRERKRWMRIFCNFGFSMIKNMKYASIQ